MKQVILVLVLAFVGTALANKGLSNVVSAALANFINNGPYLSLYSKYTPATSKVYTPVAPGSCRRNLETLDFRNASSFTGGLKDVWQSGTIKWGFVAGNVDNDTYYGLDPERGQAYETLNSLTDEIGYVLGKNIKSQITLFDVDENKGFLKTIVEGLAKNEYHAVVDVGWLPSRVNVVDFSCWYDSPASWSLYAKGNLTVGDTAPQSLADWSKDKGAGLRVAYFAGSITQEVNDLYFPEGTPVLVTSNQEAFAKIEAGDADISISQDADYETWLGDHANSTIVPQPGTGLTYGGGTTYAFNQE